jgi:hypothetical protein
MTTDEQAAWALSLLTTETRRQVGATLRFYPDGLTSGATRHLRVEAIAPKMHRRLRDAYHRAITLLVAKRRGCDCIADASVVSRPLQS